jgi:hypothetical protein
MSTNRHAADRAKGDHTSPPPGPDRMTDQDHALRAGRQGTTQRRMEAPEEARTRKQGRDDGRSGSRH